jgi:cytochrome c peroxidase
MRPPNVSRITLMAGAALVAVLAGATLSALPVASGKAHPAPAAWTADEVALLAGLRLTALEPLPADPSNRVADDPRAVALGHRLFFDTRLSRNGAVSCATCHDPAQDFQDGRALAEGVGRTDRRTMPIAHTAWSPWMFWDGRKDSQWAQALGPLESAVEHGGSRAQYAHLVVTHYGEAYEQLFGALPDLRGLPVHAGPVADASARAAWERLSPADRDAATQVFVNIGKAIAAYERRIQYAPARFDQFVDSLMVSGHAPTGILSEDEVAGLRLFLGKGTCINCHNGPLLTDQHFHNTGVPAPAGLPADAGRAHGAPTVMRDEFNCRSQWSDAPASACTALEYMVPEGKELVRAFKTPSLRNVAARAPYMHAGQLRDLDAVVRHYDLAPPAPQGTSELRPLRLSARERRQLVAFLHTLRSPLATPHALTRPPR